MKMTLEHIIEELGLKVFAGKNKISSTVKGAYASDLLSDVMGRAKEGEVWITMQTHKNIVAVASLKELVAIIIVNGLKPDEDVVTTAESEGVVLLGTTERSFGICGKLYKMMERDAVV